MKKRRFAMVTISILTSITLLSCSSLGRNVEAESIDLIQFNPPQDGQEIAIVKTNIGDITMVLFEDKAPETVDHFKKLVLDGFYDNQVIFTQPLENSIITGAIESPTDQGKLLTDDNKPIQCEIVSELWHFSGAVSSLGYKHTALGHELVSDSRFAIIDNTEPTLEMVEQMTKYSYPPEVISAYREYGGMPEYTGYYTVFGQVIEGMDIVSEIATYKTDINDIKPIDEVIIECIEISKYELKK